MQPPAANVMHEREQQAAAPTKRKPHAIMRWIWLGAGHITLAIGVIGVIVPLLPTTPFLLLSAFCYSRGSDKFESWLVNHRYLGPPVRDWRENGVIRPWAKILASVVICSSMIWVISREHIPHAGKIAMACILGPVLLFIITRRNRADT